LQKNEKNIFVGEPITTQLLLPIWTSIFSPFIIHIFLIDIISLLKTIHMNYFSLKKCEKCPIILYYIQTVHYFIFTLYYDIK